MKDIVMVAGMGKSGISAAELILNIGGRVLLYDSNETLDSETVLSKFDEENVKNIVFSSSATVYGDPKYLPIDEKHPLSTTNPYGTTKLFIEQILEDVYKADNDMNIVILRYFNPVGAHKSGLIGENPKGIPNNLMPIVLKVATGELEKVKVFGNDYDTIDGTGVRDYIHVVDLAKGHVAALKKSREKQGILEVYNLGMGRGYSVLEIITKFEEVTGLKVKKEIVGRRQRRYCRNICRYIKSKKRIKLEART